MEEESLLGSESLETTIHHQQQQQQKQEERLTPSRHVWTRMVVFIVGVGAVIASIFVLVVLTRMTPTPSSYDIMSLKGYSQIDMAKSGAIMYTSLPSTDREYLFQSYKSAHSKTYANEEEETKKKKHFEDFLALIDERNAKERSNGGSAVHGITKFADLSAHEFRTYFLSSYRKNHDRKQLMKQGIVKYRDDVVLTPGTTDVGGVVDWTGIYAGDVQNQGYCGSCWAFAVSEQVQADGIREGHLTLDQTLSVQQILTCDSTADGYKTDDNGCSGGDPIEALDYVKKSGGLCLDSAYPYTDSGFSNQPTEEDAKGTSKVTKKTCKKLVKEAVISVSNYYVLADETDMINYVKSTGPLAVCIDATDWNTYTSGVVTVCPVTEVDHCAQITGYNVDGNYWIVRNQWGGQWGEGGYIYVQAGNNLCGIASEAIYTETYVDA